MSLDKLSKYKINKAFTDGVDIYLDEAPEVRFRVRLPGQYNRAYMAEVYGAMDMSFGDDGEVEATANVLKARDTQESAFLNHCLISIDGEFVPDGFAEEYPDALAELMLKATELGTSIVEGVQDAAKKVITFIDWQDKWGSRLDFYAELKARGRVDEEDVAPEIGPYRMILSAVMELNTERQIGMMVGPIPISSITSYLREYSLPEWWAPVIAAIDAHILSVQAEEVA